MSRDVQVIVPEFLIGAESFFRHGERLSVADLGQLRTVLSSSHSPTAAQLWDENGTVRRNVIVVRNGELVPRAEYGALSFDDGDEIEFLLQFAGG
ncbi:MoaD/ThiS family protein [Streptomyces canus]|uniref:MoaD/ThiS family protein n=1 Tax=Streptomyces canus TaxID=58343 RepID=UPI00224C87EE|nr:MoaD/ThiS family protein [Streptomyces canus]MCX4852725.1 MoaD/ThiS family protein [Streptomyces canus]